MRSTIVAVSYKSAQHSYNTIRYNDAQHHYNLCCAVSTSVITGLRPVITVSYIRAWGPNITVRNIGRSPILLSTAGPSALQLYICALSSSVIQGALPLE